MLRLFYILALLLASVRLFSCVQVCLLILWSLSLLGWNISCRLWGFLWCRSCFFWLWSFFSLIPPTLRGFFLSRLASLLLLNSLAPSPTGVPSTSPSSASPPSSAAASLRLYVQLVFSRYVVFCNFLLTCKKKEQETLVRIECFEDVVDRIKLVMNEI